MLIVPADLSNELADAFLSRRPPNVWAKAGLREDSLRFFELIDRALLSVPQRCVATIQPEQSRMCAPLRDRARIEHDDLVAVNHGREAMRNDERRVRTRYL